jgi:hypothetical protein
MPEQLDQPGTTTAEGEHRATEWICGAPHIRSYVSGAIMWRRRRAARKFAATGELGRHII